ncbi:hypothetical protein EON80_10795 [bacterium]|nr:MAG: hypothetical protein EON80_10795 [bacterium]
MKPELSRLAAANHYVSSFANAFLIGASIPLALYSYESIKDLKMQIGKFKTSGDAAWLLAALQCGLLFGIGGVIIAAVKRRNED